MAKKDMTLEETVDDNRRVNSMLDSYYAQSDRGQKEKAAAAEKGKRRKKAIDRYKKDGE